MKRHIKLVKGLKWTLITSHIWPENILFH